MFTKEEAQFIIELLGKVNTRLLAGDAGSIWLDLSGLKAYACFDASTGAADWRLLN